MTQAYYNMVTHLKVFKDSYKEYKHSGDSLQAEILHNNRFIKKEVIDVAALTESVSQSLVIMNRKMDLQFSQLNHRLDQISQ